MTPPPVALQALHYHLIWLSDAAAHAANLHGGLDGVEAQLLKSTGEFKAIFDGMQIKVYGVYHMLRIAPRMVSALRHFTQESMAHIAIFRAFLAELREHLEGAQA